MRLDGHRLSLVTSGEPRMHPFSPLLVPWLLARRQPALADAAMGTCADDHEPAPTRPSSG